MLANEHSSRHRACLELCLGLRCWSTTWSSWRHLSAFGAQKKCLKRSTDEQRTRATSPKLRREVAVTHPERPGQSDIERSLAFLVRHPSQSDLPERHGEVARVSR
ncbi:hypothetical protein F2Q69_00027246 [Brassica cretica]|uniref:Uncharacterized protein n=1 Tax=Brassica cretica TaxID=69181 RepID=A0A8S9RZR8_BRACR|nr:hypothetical protein F2Q69_00027246 [Brassica cretica]